MRKPDDLRILIADDDATSRFMLSAVIRKFGHDVVEVTDGDAAWRVLRDPQSPRVAIIDWMMPGMDGIEVVRRVRTLATDRPTYLIVLTAKDEKADVIAGLDAGADDYLAKPFDAGELRARVEVGRRLVELQDSLLDKVGQLQQALDEIRTLRGVIPICAHCKQIRDDAGFWQQVEVFVRDHTEAVFSHSLCPTCRTTLYPELADDE